MGSIRQVKSELHFLPFRRSKQFAAEQCSKPSV